jgi:putative MATE family efflux protein
MFKIIEKIYAANNMINKDKVLGELPSTKEFYKSAAKMAWPSALESVLVQLIAAVDLIMVGSLGAPAIAAVGITSQPKFILLAVILSLNIGVTAVVARRRGEGDRDGANNSLRQALLISGVMAFVLTVLGYYFARRLLLFAGAQTDVIENAVIYFKIICVGNLFTSMSLTINAAQRGCGNTKISMKTNVAANLVNVLFNFLLINGNLGFPALGVKGAAIATGIGNVVGFIMSVRSITTNNGFLEVRRGQSWKLEKSTISSILNISSSAFVEQVFMRIGFFTTNKLIAGLGTVYFATHQICMNILAISFAFGDGLGIAASALVGQSLGANRPDKATIYGKILQRIALSMGFVFAFIFIVGRSSIVALFTNDLEVITVGAQIMLVIAATTPLQMSQVVIAGCLRGAGDTKFVATTSFISIGLVRPGATWLFCYPLGLGLLGAWFAFSADQSLRLAINFIRFLNGKWTKITI